MSKDDIKRKLINDPEWEPSSLDVKKDPEIWSKIDEVMEDMHGAPLDLFDDEDPKPKKKKVDEFDDIFGENNGSLTGVSAGDLNYSDQDYY